MTQGLDFIPSFFGQGGIWRVLEGRVRKKEIDVAGFRSDSEISRRGLRTLEDQNHAEIYSVLSARMGSTPTEYVRNW